MGKSGKTLAEYALILFLVALTSIPAMQILGSTINELLTRGDATSQAGQLFALLDVTGGQDGNNGGIGKNPSGSRIQAETALATASDSMNPGSGAFPGTAYFNRNGQPIVTVKTLEDGTGMPATSTNGGALVTTNEVGLYSSFKLAKAMDELAKEADNPIEAAYLEKLAYYSYYMGHAEGELDDIPGIDIPPGYSNRDALNDLLSLQKDLKKTLDNPPKNAGSELLEVGRAMASEVYSVSQQYTSALDQFIDPGGKVTTYFRNATSCATNCVMGGEAGLAMNETNFRVGENPDDPPSSLLGNTAEFGEYGGDYNFFKQKANAALDSGSINSEPVVVTFTDARLTDETAGTLAGDRPCKTK